MRAILTSIFVLFITFSCKMPKPPVSISNLNMEIKETIVVSADLILRNDLNESDLESYEFGFIYQMNAETESIDYFTLDNQLENVKGNIDNDLSFYYSFNDFALFDYFIPITIRGYVITNEQEVIYTSEIKTYKIYDLAIESSSSNASSIIEKINLNTSFNENFNLDFSIDSENRGFKVTASFDEYDKNNIYGILYKYNASENEQNTLNFFDKDYYMVYQSDSFTSVDFSFQEVLESIYSYDITFRSFVYNKEDDSFIFMDNPVTTSVYDIALLDDSEFSKHVLSKVVIIDNIFINTDVLGEYEVGSYSEGINVLMDYDYLTIKLTITALEGYRFSPNISFEDIEILRVDDNIKVVDFILEKSGLTLIIEYPDYGWGPPM